MKHKKNKQTKIQTKRPVWRSIPDVGTFFFGELRKMPGRTMATIFNIGSELAVSEAVSFLVWLSLGVLWVGGCDWLRKVCKMLAERYNQTTT